MRNASTAPWTICRTARLADNLVPIADEMPDIHLVHVETPEASTQLSAKEGAWLASQITRHFSRSLSTRSGVRAVTQSTFDFVRDNIAQTPFHQWLLPELVEVNNTTSSVVVRLATRPEFYRLPGKPELHGGVVAAMVDITGHAAIAARVLHSVATVDMRVDYLRLAGGSFLLATGAVVKLGRTIGVVDVRINDDQNRLVAIGRAAYVTMNM